MPADATPTPVRVLEVDDLELEGYLKQFVVVENEYFPHQLDMQFVLCKLYVRPTCAHCAWAGTAYRPERDQFPRAVKEYRSHLLALPW